MDLKDFKADLFHTVVYDDGEFVVWEDCEREFRPNYFVFEKCSGDMIGRTNCSYYMGQVRQIIRYFKKMFQSKN